MHPVLFRIGDIAIYSYGLLIAIGAVVGVGYMAVEGRRSVGLTFEQANNLFLIIFVAAFVGGKVFLVLEDPANYLANPRKLLSSSGFVFYGSFIFAVPSMLWYFKRIGIPILKMLDVMAITTCLVHIFGRVGCFMAGCCYGQPTDSIFAVVFEDPTCQAEPLGVPLHPVQLYEAGYIFMVMIILLFVKQRARFDGQLFLLYLILYACGRFALEYFRGDETRGFVVENLISHSQFIAILIVAIVSVLYWRLARKTQVAQ